MLRFIQKSAIKLSQHDSGDRDNNGINVRCEIYIYRNSNLWSFVYGGQAHRTIFFWVSFSYRKFYNHTHIQYTRPLIPIY